MNYLAHVFLAPDSPEARIGSVLGDFRKGFAVETLPPEIVRGVNHHLAVDAYTDSHPQVVASRRLFSSQRRRFAGVALDIVYDHYLLKYWPVFGKSDSNDFIDKVYSEFDDFRPLMPPAMARVTELIVAHDWFGHYREMDDIGHALDRVAQRVRFKNRFEGIIEEIHEHETELEARFLEFFKDLQQSAAHF